MELIKNTNYATNKTRDFLIKERAGEKTCSECREYNCFRRRCLKINKNKAPYKKACSGFYEN